MKLNINQNTVKLLVRYLANPLLTTIQFHHEIDNLFPNLMFDSPDHDGVFACKSKPFCTYKPIRMTKDTVINICAYCKGLTLLDSHRMNFVYFYPNGLKYITSEIIDAWKASQLTVCSVHFLHRSKRASNGKIWDMIPNL